MKNKIYEVHYAGNPIRYAFINQKARRLFKRHLKLSVSQDFDIRSTQERIERARRLLPPDSEDFYIEYRTLISLTAKELLKYGCCIFHCVSFIYKGYAWLLSAPSGTGKTTQYFNWNRLFPGEIEMISGDMPVLKLEQECQLSVHPSPWNGKEDIGSMNSAPLGGIIYLEQGNDNLISSLSVSEGLINIFRQFIVVPETEDQILSLTKLIEAMFVHYPVMKFTNRGDDQSTELLRNTINRILEDRYDT